MPGVNARISSGCILMQAQRHLKCWIPPGAETLRSGFSAIYFALSETSGPSRGILEAGHLPAGLDS